MLVTNFVEVYSVYEAKFGSNQQQHTPPQETEEQSKNKSFWSMIGSRLQGHGRGSSSASSSSSQPLLPINPQQSSDLTQYIELDSNIDPDDENCKVLDWWHKRQSRFPVLSQLARTVLIIPVSTISLESTFSTTKMIVDKRRTSLAPEMVEVLACVKDWEKAVKRNQDTIRICNEKLAKNFNNLYMNDDDES
ncbi:HAT, C-terminal dimerization domain containing protein [Trema orientale]|uniref:HAT, C-terminal dimerization domain containing protein n=1 Tax=Trema orientale TaxID=63057 RepID=A0A2P5CKE4_TREOI|nr:HAT, C-terminal dimerization domain containing protein [Trema orientale]